MEVTVKKSTGATGEALVRKLKNSIVVSFENGDSYEIDDVSQLPAKFENGKYQVALSADGTKIFRVGPTQGSYAMDWVEVANKTNGVPDTKLIRGGKLITLENGQKFLTKDQLVWYVDLKVIAPENRFDGLTVRHSVPFIFIQSPTNTVMMSGTKKELEKLDTFLRSFGMDVTNIVIPYGPANTILTFIDNYMQEHKRAAYVTLNAKGYVDTVSMLPDQLLPKRTTPRKKAK